MASIGRKRERDKMGDFFFGIWRHSVDPKPKCPENRHSIKLIIYVIVLGVYFDDIQTYFFYHIVVITTAANSIWERYHSDYGQYGFYIYDPYGFCS